MREGSSHMILSIEQARQAEARTAWAKGELVVGAYYQHRRTIEQDFGRGIQHRISYWP